MSETCPSSGFGRDYRFWAPRLAHLLLHLAVCYATALAPFVCPGQLRSCRCLEETGIGFVGNAPLDSGRTDVPVLFQNHPTGR